MKEHESRENILKQLSEHARERTRISISQISLGEMKERAEARAEQDRAAGKADFRFEEALKKPGVRMICECKKASPSKGMISPLFPYLEIAQEYERSGADCISVLTEPKWFHGDIRYLQEIADTVSIPCLRKDFIVDPYMVYEAKAFGAEAVLLICSILSEEEIAQYLGIANELGMSSLVETHDEQQIRSAIRAGARVIGVNNRNLENFKTDLSTAERLRPFVPEGILYVVESGIDTAEDARRARECGADALLVGESLMRAPDRRYAMENFRRVLHDY